MTDAKRRPLGSGAVLLGGEQSVPTVSTLNPQREIRSELAPPDGRHAALRLRLAAAATYGEEVCAWALSPCSRDLAWWICRIARHYADDRHAPLAAIEREIVRVENLWRACMEVETLESGQWPAGVAQ